MSQFIITVAGLSLDDCFVSLDVHCLFYNMIWTAVAVTVVATLWAQQGQAHVITPGKCPHMQVKQNFDIQKYMGTWYGHASFGTESTQGKGRCVTARYSYNQSEGQIDVYNWQIPSPGYRGSINGSAVPLHPDLRVGELQVTFVIAVNKTKTFPLQILDTDYDHWAVVYFCRDLLRHHETSGWILTREQNLENSLDKDMIDDQVAKVLKKANLNFDAYTKTEQNDCTASS